MHITYVFNVANAVYLPRKLLSKVDKNRNKEVFYLLLNRANFDINRHKILPSYLP